LLGAVGSWSSPPGEAAWSWNSEICPAGQPVLAVMWSRQYRWVAAGKSMVTALPEAGLKVYPAEVLTVLKFVPSEPPWMVSVWVRVCHAAGAGTFSTI
jgi:hypothetical protein